MSIAPPDHESSLAKVEDIRAQFPALERIHNSYPVAYFDGPGGTQVPRSVVEAMADYLYHHNANTHWAYPTSEETDLAIEQAREMCAEFLNASSDEIVFGANMTSITFHLSRALGVNYGPGDEIVVTELDHHANLAPWKRLVKERGVTVRCVPMDPETGQLEWNAFESLVCRNTRLIAVGAASNALGTINDLSRAARLAKSVGAQLFVDGVHYAPHALVDVQALDCDYFAMSAYKFYGPHVGVLYCKSDLLNAIDFPKLIPAGNVGPERAETGTQNQEGMVGTGAAVGFLASLVTNLSGRPALEQVYQQLHRRAVELTRRLWEGLASIKGVHTYGPSPSLPRTPTVSFTVDGITSTEVARRLAEQGLFLSHGDFYAATVVDRLDLGPEGLVRAGCACYTTMEEIERLIEGVALIANRP